MSPTPSDVRRLAWRAVGSLPAPVRDLAQRPVTWRGELQLRRLTPMMYGARRVYLGPLNTAGQAWEWARALERHVPGTVAQNLWAQRVLDQKHFGYRADHEISLVAQRGHVQEQHGLRVLHDATHVAFESGRPLLAGFHDPDRSMLDDLPAVEANGLGHALIWHGSDIRDLDEHAERFPHSPFRGERDDYLDLLQSKVEANQAVLEAYLDGPVGRGGAVFVTTPDLLDMVPGSVWLPLVVDVERFGTAADVAGVVPLERERPVVLHAPSNSRLKGGPVVQEQMAELDRRGLITYRLLQGVPHALMPQMVADADIVLDQFALGATGAFAAESQAAGRVVVAHVAEHVRARMVEVDGEEPPVVEAGPEQVGEVVERIVADRGTYQELARRARDWSLRHHDGRRSAEVLATWLRSGHGRA